MNKTEFWSIMDRCRDTNSEVYFASLEDALTDMSAEEQQRFRAYLAAYLEAAAECVWLDMACKVINGYVSDDTSLYFSLWVISQGELPLLQSLMNPDSLADLPTIPFGNADFEFLMSVGAPEEEECEIEDWDEDGDLPGDIGMLGVGIENTVRKNCRQEVQNDIQYKNGDRYGGYDTFEDAMDDIPNVLPRLILRAEQAGFSWRS